MNIEEIDKWLDNEYGTSYTRLEELHNYFFEKYTDQKEEIKRLNKNKKETLDFIERYLSLDLDNFNASSLLRKIREILDREKK